MAPLEGRFPEGDPAATGELGEGDVASLVLLALADGSTCDFVRAP